uniref:Uncharacterized protein n=1 Tax=Meloidogyne floridensis TaxID=298350 RepID=A0A915NQ37_9BILA
MTEINLKDSQQQQECLAFEPQNYLKDRCKKCFRLKDKHESNLPIRKPKLERKTSFSSSTSKIASDAANGKTTKLAKTKSSASKNNSATASKNSATASINNFVSASKINSASTSQNNSASVSNNSASKNNFASTNSVSNSLSTKKHSPPTTNKSSPKKVLATNIANNKNNIPVPTNVATTFRRIPIQRSSSGLEEEETTEKQTKLIKNKNNSDKNSDIKNQNSDSNNIDEKVKQKPIVTKQKEENNKQQKELKEASNEVEINEVLHTKSDENNELEIKTIIMTPTTSKTRSNKTELKEPETSKTLATPKTSTSSSSSSSSSSTTTTTVLLPKQRRQISQISGSKSFKEVNNNLLQNENINEAEVRSEANNNESVLNKIGNNLTIVVEENGINKEKMREDEVDEILSLCSYKTANSRLANSSSPSNFPVSANNVNGNGSNGHSQSEMFSAQSIDSLNSISFADSYKTSLRSPPPFFDNDDDFLTPTSTMDGHFFNQNIYNNFINQVQDENEELGEFESRARTPTAKSHTLDYDTLQSENQRLAEKCRRYKNERQRWTEWLARRATTISGTTTPTNGKEPKLQIENNNLNALQQRRQRQQQLAEQNLNARSFNHEQQLSEQLVSAELINAQLRQERDELQQEIDEIQDQCRMEEIEEFRELQRELDLNAKNCRILQFKLRKSERQREQLQAERCVLVSRCEELLDKNNKLIKNEEKSEEEKSEEISEEQKFAQMEQELHVAKQISIKLQNELEAAEERRCRLEDELFYNREKVRELLAQNKWREAKNNREQQQNIRPRGEALIISSAALMVDGSSHVSARPEHFEEEEEPKEIQREVRDSMEREADLREQLRFTEADLQRTRNRMRELETENDDLLQKYTRLADQQAQNLSMLPGGLLTPKRPSLFRSIRQVAQNYNFEGNDSKMLTKGIISGNNRLNQGEQSSPKKSQRSASHCSDTKEASEIIKGVGKEDNTIVDTEQLCYMLAAMDAQANRICKQLEKIEGSGNKEERRRSLKGGEIASVLEELAKLLSEMKAIKEQLAHSQNISLTKSMILGNVLGDNNTNDCGKSKQECEDGSSKLVGNYVCTVCEEKERKIREFEQSCDFYKRKNGELTEQVLQMRDQWAKELQKAEEEANTQKVLAEKEITSLRNALDKQITETQSARDLLENTRAENVTLRKAMAEREAELSQAKEKAGGLEKGLDQSRIWESRCKEAKAERIRLQAELTQLRMRTDEALQELEKMRATHQQKEIVWIREKLKLEDLLKQSKQQQQLPSPKTSIEKIIPVVVQMSKPSVNMCCSPSKQLEKQTDLVENNNVKQECVKVDYKQIADNALRAAESLQRQYREYQSHYTAEVERLNARLNNLEREHHQKRLEKSEEKKLNQAFPTFGLQVNRIPMAESPSMSSLTENTTWDSRLLDCSMARSVSPFKFPRGACTTPTSVKACRMDNILFRSQGAEKIISGEFGSDEDSTSAMAAANAAASTNKAHREYRRTSSSGTNILYRIRREELSKGKCPSVRQMAKAFDSFEQTRLNEKEAAAQESRRRKEEKSNKTKNSSGLFGLLNKASSMDQSLSSAGRKLPPSKAKAKRRPSDHQAAALQNELLLTKNNSGEIAPRGGRNPFKGMGSRLVERVRRSLSRTGKKRSHSRDEGTPLSMSLVAATGNETTTLMSSSTTAASING